MKNLLLRIRNFLSTLNSRASIALMATVVSTCALCVSLYQARLSRAQQLASVWPYVSIGGQSSSHDSEQSWSFLVTNNGLGPAIIEEVKVRYDSIETDFSAMIDTFYAHYTRQDSLKNLNYSINAIDKQNVIPAGEHIEWFAFNLSYHGKPAYALIRTHMSNFAVAIRYKSLYGETWESYYNWPGEEDAVKKIE